MTIEFLDFDEVITLLDAGNYPVFTFQDWYIREYAK